MTVEFTLMIKCQPTQNKLQQLSTHHHQQYNMTVHISTCHHYHKTSSSAIAEKPCWS